jgi:hypothetical protein
MANSEKKDSALSMWAFVLILIGAALLMNGWNHWPQNPRYWELLMKSMPQNRGGQLDESKTLGENMLERKIPLSNEESDDKIDPNSIEQFLPWWKNYLLITGIAFTLMGVVSAIVANNNLSDPRPHIKCQPISK